MIEIHRIYGNKSSMKVQPATAAELVRIGIIEQVNWEVVPKNEKTQAKIIRYRKAK